MGFMGDGFGRFRSSGVIYRATCGTTTTAGYTQHWIIAPPLTMSDGPRKTWLSTKPREDPHNPAVAQPASLGIFLLENPDESNTGIITDPFHRTGPAVRPTDTR